MLCTLFSTTIHTIPWLWLHPVPYRPQVLSTPVPQVRPTSPHPFLALCDGHQHLVTQQVTLGSSLYLGWQVWPGHRGVAEEFCSFLQVRIVGDVERLAGTEHVCTVGFVQDSREEERAGWERDRITPGAIRLASRLGSYHWSSFISPWWTPRSIKIYIFNFHSIKSSTYEVWHAVPSGISSL